MKKIHVPTEGITFLMPSTSSRACTQQPCTRKVTENGMCAPHNEEGLWENTHEDEGHETDPDDTQSYACWICHPELNEATVAPKKGHTNTIAKTYSSHKDCAHASTPADRAKCRKARTTPSRVKPTPDVLHTPAGDIRVGSLINAFLPDGDTNVKVTEISLDIKKGRPGWEARGEGRWGYADDVRRVISF